MIMRPILTSCLSMAIASLPINVVNANELPIISRLIVREGTVVIRQDANGELKYSLIDRAGNPTETNISETQLAAKYPDLYDRFHPAVADTDESPYAGTLDFQP